MRAGPLVLPAVVAGVASGVLAADALSMPPLGPVAVGAALALAGLGTGSRGAIVVAAAAVAVGVGAWRGATSAEPVPPDRSVASLVGGGDRDLAGTVVDDPRPRADRVQLVLADVASVPDTGGRTFDDRLLAWMPRGADIGAGDRIIVTGRVELAEDFDGFAYREYLAHQGVSAIVRARAVRVIGEASGPSAALAALRRLLLGGLNELVPEPEAALGAGILLGVRSSIAPEIDDAFATAGLTHVVAISGWNIAIVAALVAAAVRPLARRPGGRWTTALVAGTVVGGYVVLTGASPSVVRAALMAGAMLVARLGGSRAHAASARRPSTPSGAGRHRSASRSR